MVDDHAERPGPPTATDLPRVAVRGALLSYGAFAASKLIAFGSTMALTRLLAPEQFGVVAYGLAVLQYLDVVTTSGTTGAVIAARQRAQETTNSAFVTSVTAGVVLYGASWAAAPALARFFGAPELEAVLRVLAVGLPLGGLGAVPNAVLHRDLDFKARLIVDVGSSATKATVAVALALGGCGVWSLVAGQVASEAATAALGWSLAGWRPTASWSREANRHVGRVGWHLVCVGLAGALVSNVDYLIVGRLLGPVALGYYTLAYRVPELMLTSLNWVIGRVSFPVLVNASLRGRSVERFYFAYVRYVTLVALPTGAGLAIVAAPFVETLFSARWMASAPVMQLIAIALALSTISHVPGSIYKATGRTAVLNHLTLVKLFVSVAALAYGARWGIVGVAAAQCSAVAVHLVLDGAVIARVAGIGPGVTLSAALPAAAASGAMAACLVGSRVTARLAGLQGIAAAVSLGGVVYLSVLTIFWPAAIREAWSALRAATGRPRPVAAPGRPALEPRERGLA